MEKKVQNTRAHMESEYDVKDIIVIDNGADTIKIGISGEDYPRLIIPAIAGIPDIKSDQEGQQTKPTPLFGERLQQAREEKKFNIFEKQLIAEGRIQLEPNQNNPQVSSDNQITENMTKLWDYALKDCLQVSDTQACNLLIIDSPHNDKDYKHKIANTLFEELKVNSVLFMNSATLSLFSTGLTTGLVVESGHSITSVVPIFEGFPIPHSVQKSSLAGDEMTKQLDKFLKAQGQGELSIEKIKEIKEKMCYVAKQYYTDINGPDQFSVEDKSYELPDGSVIEINPQMRYSTTEILFDPSIIGDKSKSLVDMMIDSLTRCDLELEQELQSNIVLCGGSSLFRGFQERIEEDLFTNYPKKDRDLQKKDFYFVPSTHRRYSAWIGGSMLGSLSTFQSLAISRSEYEDNPENKISIIHKKTF